MYLQPNGASENLARDWLDIDKALVKRVVWLDIVHLARDTRR